VNKYAKFGLLMGGIIGVLALLAVKGIQDTKTYYKKIAEISQMGTQASAKRLRVGGDVGANSIVHDGGGTHFTLVQVEDGRSFTLNVVYSGVDPLPDTFKPGAQALAEGRLGADGVFHATKIQAKCASKYEAKPPQTVVPRTT